MPLFWVSLGERGAGSGEGRGGGVALNTVWPVTACCHFNGSDTVCTPLGSQAARHGVGAAASGRGTPKLLTPRQNPHA